MATAFNPIFLRCHFNHLMADQGQNINANATALMSYSVNSIQPAWSDHLDQFFWNTWFLRPHFDDWILNQGGRTRFDIMSNRFLSIQLENSQQFENKYFENPFQASLCWPMCLITTAQNGVESHLNPKTWLGSNIIFSNRKFSLQ